MSPATSTTIRCCTQRAYTISTCFRSDTVVNLQAPLLSSLCTFHVALYPHGQRKERVSGRLRAGPFFTTKTPRPPPVSASLPTKAPNVASYQVLFSSASDTISQQRFTAAIKIFSWFLGKQNKKKHCNKLARSTVGIRHGIRCQSKKMFRLSGTPLSGNSSRAPKKCPQRPLQSLQTSIFTNDRGQGCTSNRKVVHRLPYIRPPRPRPREI